MKTIFLSSTFQDMHYERDVIHDRVTPALNRLARQYGESVAFCDLRWGATPWSWSRASQHWRSSLAPWWSPTSGAPRSATGIWCSAWSCHNSSSYSPTASGIRPWRPWRGGGWKKRKQSKRVHPAVLLLEGGMPSCSGVSSPSAGH